MVRIPGISGGTFGFSVDLTNQTFQLGAPSAPITTIQNFVNIEGSAGIDTLKGDAQDNLISGGGNNDTLIGSAGNDTLDGVTSSYHCQ